MQVRVHPTADISPDAQIGDGTVIWHQAQVREGACLGRDCVVGKGVYVDAGVNIGDNVKIQNYLSIYHGVVTEDGVFCGPHCVFVNDKHPRAINTDGSLKGADDWEVTLTRVCHGAAIGANSTILCGVTIGRWAMVGAGSVVTRDVTDHGLVLGNPARLRGFVCMCGEQLERTIGDLMVEMKTVNLLCPKCGTQVNIPAYVYQETGGGRDSHLQAIHW